MDEGDLKVLLVEDNPGDAMLIVHALRSSSAPGTTVTPASDLREARSHLGKEPFDVILLDLRLPDARGMEAVKAIRSAAPEIPTIVLTGARDRRLAIQALQEGIQDYVRKDTLTGETLLQSIRYGIERKRFHDALRRRDAELRQAQKLEAIGQLAAGIAHEINTPMQFIGDNLLFLRDACQDIMPLLEKVERSAPELLDGLDLGFVLAEVPQALDQSLEGVERVTKIVRAMKEFSHPGSNEKTPLDIHSAIESTLTVCRNEYKYVADVTTDFDPSVGTVACIPGDFNQVILNLVVNAAHAIAAKNEDGSEERGRITIQTFDRNDEVEIRVTDTGTGIPAAVRDRVFEPFFTTKEVGKGTGQGLAFAYAVVAEKHSGQIRLESTEGEGTTFVITLPKQAVTEPEKGHAHPVR